MFNRVLLLYTRIMYFIIIEIGDTNWWTLWWSMNLFDIFILLLFRTRSFYIKIMENDRNKQKIMIRFSYFSAMSDFTFKENDSYIIQTLHLLHSQYINLLFFSIKFIQIFVYFSFKLFNLRIYSIICKLHNGVIIIIIFCFFFFMN